MITSFLCLLTIYKSPWTRNMGVNGVFYFGFIILAVNGTGKILFKFSYWVEPNYKLHNFQSMKNFSFCTPCWDAFTKYGHQYFCRFAALCCFFFVCFLFLLSNRQDMLSIKSRNALLLNIGRACLINFVTINLLGGCSWFFLSIRVKAFIRANKKYAN